MLPSGVSASTAHRGECLSLSLAHAFSSLSVTVFVTICCCVVPSPSSLPHFLLLLPSFGLSLLLTLLLPPLIVLRFTSVPVCVNNYVFLLLASTEF